MSLFSKTCVLVFVERNSLPLSSMLLLPIISFQEAYTTVPNSLPSILGMPRAEQHTTSAALISKIRTNSHRPIPLASIALMAI